MSPRSRASAAACCISSMATAPRHSLRCRIRVARRQKSAAKGRRAVLHRSPHPQCPSRQHGCLDGLLRRAVQLPADPLRRYRGPRLRPVFTGAGRPRRPDPDPDQRGCRPIRPDRGISADLSRRGYPAYRQRRKGYLPHRGSPARGRPAVHAVTARHLFREDRCAGCPGRARISNA